MNYSRIYESLVSRARHRQAIGYVERHHILPKCLGGDDAKENLVDLYPEEHLLAHLLLVKMNPGNEKLVFAANMMLVSSTTQKRVTNKTYGWLRRLHVKSLSQINKGTNNPQYGKMWITNGDQNQIIPKDNHIPNGWTLGRVGKFGKTRQPKRPRIVRCEVCDSQFELIGRQTRRFCNSHLNDNRRKAAKSSFQRVTDQQIIDAVGSYPTRHQAALALGYKNGYSGNVISRFEKLVGPLAQKK